MSALKTALEPVAGGLQDVSPAWMKVRFSAGVIEEVRWMRRPSGSPGSGRRPARGQAPRIVQLAQAPEDGFHPPPRRKEPIVVSRLRPRRPQPRPRRGEDAQSNILRGCRAMTACW